MQPEPPSLHQQIFSPNSEQATPTSSVYGHGHILLLMEINRSDAAVVYNTILSQFRFVDCKESTKAAQFSLSVARVVGHSVGANVPLNS